MTDTGALLVAPSPPRQATPAAPTPGAAGVAQTSGAATAATTLRARLNAAEQAARAGRLDVARGLCASAILHDQPLLAGSAELLRQAIAALLYSQAFGQIARLLAAVQGRRVRVRADLTAGGAIVAVAPAGPDAPEDYVLDPTRFAAPDGDQFVRRCAAILAAEPRQDGCRQDNRPAKEARARGFAPWIPTKG